MKNEKQFSVQSSEFSVTAAILNPKLQTLN
jgi:hypothetical protein